MPPPYAAIYLSPHLDDVALSCGGQIAAQTTAGRSILVVTLMAGDPPPAPLSDFAQTLHQRWQLPANVVAQRRQEDAIACQVLDVDFIHWQIPDCIYRSHPQTGKPLYASEDAIFGRVHRADSELLDGLARRLAGLPAHGRLFLPLAIGHHVDHQITRATAERCFGLTSLNYYEDYPYVTEPGALAAVIPPDRTGWQVDVILLTETSLQAKIEAIAAYGSQLSTFFDGRSHLEKQIRDDARAVGGERIWQRVSSDSADRTIR
jgi:LmbE family N-acetylglucosaminyl deacetylase